MVFSKQDVKHLKPKKNGQYSIEIRGRGVKGIGNKVATHCFLVLLDKEENVLDSLSFDPSNSKGLKDADPYNKERGSLTVVKLSSCYETWKNLIHKYEEFAGKANYNVVNHNCCDAATYALSAVNSDVRSAMGFAREANKKWDNAQNKPSEEQSYKKLK